MNQNTDKPAGGRTQTKWDKTRNEIEQATRRVTAHGALKPLALYGEGVSKFYASKDGSKTLEIYKLDPNQREEVNALIEVAENDLEAVLFKLVWQRDTLRNHLLMTLCEIDDHGGGYSEVAQSAKIALTKNL